MHTQTQTYTVRHSEWEDRAVYPFVNRLSMRRLSVNLCIIRRFVRHEISHSLHLRQIVPPRNHDFVWLRNLLKSAVGVCGSVRVCECVRVCVCEWSTSQVSVSDILMLGLHRQRHNGERKRQSDREVRDRDRRELRETEIQKETDREREMHTIRQRQTL